MRSRLYQCGIALFWVAALFAVVNCGGTGVLVEGEVNGGGKIVKASGTTATFTFHGSNCTTPEGRFNFLDKSAEAVTEYGKNGVMADGTIITAGRCNSQGGCSHPSIPGQTCPFGAYTFTFEYRNKNKNVVGSGGGGGACIVDGGEGKNAPDDHAAIGFADDGGAYAGWTVQGILSGNAQVGGCN